MAAIAFARLEWNAVWCCERLERGYTEKVEEHWEKGKRRNGKTAGVIATDLKELFERIVDPALRDKATPFAVTFIDLTKERKGLFHGKPGTAPDGDQRLFRHGTEWTLDAVNTFADHCVKSGAPLNALLYHEVSEPCTVALRS